MMQDFGRDWRIEHSHFTKSPAFARCKHEGHDFKVGTVLQHSRFIKDFGDDREEFEWTSRHTGSKLCLRYLFW